MIQLGGNNTPFAILTLFNNFRDNLIILMLWEFSLEK